MFTVCTTALSPNIFFSPQLCLIKYLVLLVTAVSEDHGEISHTTLNTLYGTEWGAKVPILDDLSQEEGVCR